MWTKGKENKKNLVELRIVFYSGDTVETVVKNNPNRERTML